MQMNTQNTPFFLTGLWESGINTLWPYIREQEGIICFYEPLHPSFSKITRKWVGQDTSAMKIMGNAPVTTPDKSLYAEMIPFIGTNLLGRGVKGYKGKYSDENFVMRANYEAPDMQDYFKQFITFAEKQNKRAIIAEHRFIYRLGWAKANITGTYAHVTRDPYAIWSIYQNALDRGYSRFFLKWFKIFEKNTETWLGHMGAPLHLRKGMDQYLIYDESFYKDVLTHMTRAETYRLVYGVWLKALFEALYNADFIIDMDKMSDKRAQDRITQQIENASGLSLDFSSFELKSFSQVEHKFEPQKIEDVIATEFGVYLKSQNRRDAKLILNSDLSHLSDKAQRSLKIVASVFD